MNILRADHGQANVLLFAGDVLLMRLELVAAWTMFRAPVLLRAGTALAPGAKVRYETVRKLVDSLGVNLTATT